MALRLYPDKLLGISAIANQPKNRLLSSPETCLKPHDFGLDTRPFLSRLAIIVVRANVVRPFRLPPAMTMWVGVLVVKFIAFQLEVEYINITSIEFNL